MMSRLARLVSRITIYKAKLIRSETQALGRSPADNTTLA